MARTPRARWLNERESHLWRSWLAAVQALDGALGEQLSSDSGVSSAEYAVLVALSESPDGTLRPRDLGRAILWARDRLSHQIRRMEQRGFVVREECAEDARGTIIRLTPSGRKAVEQAAPGHVAATRRHFIDLLSEKEIDVLTNVCDRILANLNER